MSLLNMSIYAILRKQNLEKGVFLATPYNDQGNEDIDILIDS